MAFKEVPGVDNLKEVDWSKKDNAKNWIRSVGDMLKENLTEFTQETQRIQNESKDKLKQLSALVDQAEKGTLSLSSLAMLLPEVKQNKVDIARLAQEAKDLDSDYFAAHNNWRNGNLSNALPKNVAKELQKLRTDQQNQSKVLAGKLSKIRDDYVKRASAMVKQLKTVGSGATDALKVFKRADSLLQKLDSTVNTATTDKGKAVGALGRIEKFIKDKDKKKREMAINSFADVSKGEAKIKANRKTAKQLHDTVVKLVNGVRISFNTRGQKTPQEQAGELLLAMEGLCDEVRTAHTKAEKAVKKAKVKDFPKCTC